MATCGSWKILLFRLLQCHRALSARDCPKCQPDRPEERGSPLPLKVGLAVQDRFRFSLVRGSGTVYSRNEEQNSVKRNCQLSQFTWHWPSETERIIANSVTLNELGMSSNRI